MKHPSRQECLKILNEYGTPLHVKKHCIAVADTAYRIARELNKHGYNFDLQLILGAGLLHDIARTEDKHWEIGADIAENLGYRQEAEIIRVHMRYTPFAPIGEVTETDMICLADKLVKEDKYVGIDERIDYIIKKAEREGHPEAREALTEKKEETKAFIKDIEDIIGISIDRLMGKAKDENR
ncbi:MAG: HD domain-containing protein [Anaerovoracaceae bacterium]